jgi:hypothetical protein
MNSNFRILIVEDDVWISKDIEDILVGASKEFCVNGRC